MKFEGHIYTIILTHKILLSIYRDMDEYDNRLYAYNIYIHDIKVILPRVLI